MRVLAIIPAYNAERTVADVVRETASAFAGVGEVCVVDDGSTDQTAALAAKAGARVVRHPRNLGKGVALRTGFLFAQSAGYEAVVTLDADGQHSPADARRLATLPPSETHNNTALVLGVRDLVRAGAPKPNRISNGISNGFLSVFSRTRLRDTQCGLRRYPLPLTLALGAHDPGYAFEAEVVLLAIAAKVPVVEVPISVLYPADRTSHFDAVRDPMRVIARVLRTLVATRFVTHPAPSVPVAASEPAPPEEAIAQEDRVAQEDRGTGDPPLTETQP